MQKLKIRKTERLSGAFSLAPECRNTRRIRFQKNRFKNSIFLTTGTLAFQYRLSVMFTLIGFIYDTELRMQ